MTQQEKHVPKLAQSLLCVDSLWRTLTPQFLSKHLGETFSLCMSLIRDISYDQYTIVFKAGFCAITVRNIAAQYSLSIS